MTNHIYEKPLKENKITRAVKTGQAGRGEFYEALRIMLRILVKIKSNKSAVQAVAASFCGVALLIVLGIAAAMESGAIAFASGGVSCVIISFILFIIAKKSDDS